MLGSKVHIKLFDDYIDNFINDLNDNSVYEPIKYFLKLPSKKVRPILTLISSGLYNEDLKHALPASLSNEVFHNFTLIHDDIMDSSKIRRGKETVHVKWNLNQAILSGDAMQILLDNLEIDEDEWEEHEEDIDWGRFDDIIGHYICQYNPKMYGVDGKELTNEMQIAVGEE